jgi:hypothetical protein
MMEFACNCSPDIDEYAEEYDTVVVTSDEAHRCGECGDPIEPGERHEFHSMVFHEKYGEHRLCLFCKEMVDLYCPDGFYWGCAAELISECLGFYYTDDPDEMDDDDTCPKCQGWYGKKDCELCGGAGHLEE